MFSICKFIGEHRIPHPHRSTDRLVCIIIVLVPWKMEARPTKKSAPPFSVHIDPPSFLLLSWGAAVSVPPTSFLLALIAVQTYANYKLSNT